MFLSCHISFGCTSQILTPLSTPLFLKLEFDNRELTILINSWKRQSLFIWDKVFLAKINLETTLMK
jgi:hypothetical protein